MTRIDPCEGEFRSAAAVTGETVEACKLAYYEHVGDERMLAKLRNPEIVSISTIHPFNCECEVCVAYSLGKTD